jgi:hypothetical protein
MRLSWIHRCAFGVLVAGCLSSVAGAGAIVSPTAVLGTDLGTNSETVTPLVNMINQSGLSKAFTSGVTDFDEYTTTGDQAFAQGGTGEWWSEVDFSLPVEGFVDFDLGAVHTFQRMAIWNRSLGDVQILVSETQGGPMELAGDFTLPNHTAFFSYLPTIVELDAAQTGRYLRIAVESAYPFSALDTFAYAIVGEVAIDAGGSGPSFAADFDDDGDVDGDDLTEWRGAFAATAIGDADEDADSDGADFLIWQSEAGLTPAGPSVAAVPEPRGHWLALTAAVPALLAVARRDGA